LPRLSSLTVCVLLLAGACSKAAKPAPKPAPAPEPAPVAAPDPTKPAPPPKLTAEQMTKLEAEFSAARKLVEEARALRKQGEAIEKTDGREAANPTLYKARKIYREAVAMTEQWIEGDLGVVTQPQVDAYLQKWNSERGSWIKEDASMGQKLHE